MSLQPPLSPSDDPRTEAVTGADTATDIGQSMHALTIAVVYVGDQLARIADAFDARNNT